ncbi:FAD-dependent oxidoreductase [soil metagenome]
MAAVSVSETDASPLAWDEEVDLLVCGAGAAGMTAALAASDAGLRVLVCEKHSQVGGSTATSGGMIYAPGSLVSARKGLPDNAEEARRYLSAQIGPHGDPRFIDAFVDTAATTIETLETRFGLRFEVPNPNPDYRDGPGASKGGRTLVPAAFDGRLLGADFDLVRAPRDTLTILGGMMIARREVALLLRPLGSLKALSFTLRTLARHARDRLRYKRGTRLLLGNSLVAQLLYALRRQNVPVRTGSALVDLVREEGRVVGAVLREGDSLRRVRARRGVVLSTGGFAGSKPWLARLAAHTPVEYSMAFEQSSGDAFDAAIAVGGSVDGSDDNAIFWMPVSVFERTGQAPRLWMHGVLDRAKPGLIAVDAHGRRFANEGNSYHDFVRDMQFAGLAEAHLVCDAAFIRAYGLGMVPPMFGATARYLQAGYLKRGASLAELAGAIGVDPAGLQRTVSDFNDAAADGSDPSFGRGSTALNIHNGDASHRPNPCVAPIATAPFYAVKVMPSILGTSAGLRTDIDGRVLDAGSRPIPGLYACGNDMSSMMRGSYPGPGITLGPALVFGWRAGRHAAGLEPDEPSEPSRQAAAAL